MTKNFQNIENHASEKINPVLPFKIMEGLSNWEKDILAELREKLGQVI